MMKPHDYGEEWDTSDISELKVRRSTGETIQEIADHMGRTYNGVKSKLYRLRKNDPTAVRPR